MNEFVITAKINVTSKNDKDYEKVDDLMFNLTNEIAVMLASKVNYWFNTIDKNLEINLNLDVDYDVSA